MPRILLGPLLRYVSDTEATIWVETDAACTVEILGFEAETIEVAGHHYALVCVAGLEPGSTSPYAVALDGEPCWPPAGDPFPPPVVRTSAPGLPVRMAWGSCRVSVPHEPPFTLSPDDDPHGRGIDALYAYACRMLEQDRSEWPLLALMLGDQVYADEVSPMTRESIRRRRDVNRPPGEEVADFAEYCWLYRESWSDPVIRWFLSTVSTAMIWDDHDVHDDWNTSYEWVEEMRAQPWWNKRIEGAVMSYWIYQHWGNLSPRELAGDSVFQVAQACDGDAAEILRGLARDADRSQEGTRWSYSRDLGKTRLLVIDSRGGRVLDGGRRTMVDDREWDYIRGHAEEEDHDHLIVATTLPVFLPHAMHWLEAWDEAVARGAWGARMARLGEKLRQGLDLEHWPAFHDSFVSLVDLIRGIARGDHGPVPGSVVLLSGDVHNAYLAEVGFPVADAIRCPVWQGVCSPMRNPLNRQERAVVKLASSRVLGALMKALAHRAGVTEPAVRWRFRSKPTFDNQIATLDLDGRSATMTLERALPGDRGEAKLALTFEDALTPAD